jgi:hypothetical protein
MMRYQSWLPAIARSVSVVTKPVSKMGCAVSIVSFGSKASSPPTRANDAMTCVSGLARTTAGLDVAEIEPVQWRKM